MNITRVAALGLVLLGTIHAHAMPAAAEDAAPGACAVLDDAAVQTVLGAMHGSTFDPAAVEAIMEENVVLTTPLSEVLTGRDAVVSAFDDLASSFSGLTMKSDEVLVDDPYMVVRYALTGTHTADFGEMAATGKDVATSAMTVYRMHCGMVSEAWVQLDYLGLKAQVDEEYAAFMPAEPEPTRVLTESCAAPTADDMKTLVRQMFTEAWTRSPDLAAVLDPDVVLHSALGPDLVGIAAVEPLRKRYFEAFPDLEYRRGEIIADGDLAAMMWTAVGTDTGGFLGLEPTSKVMVLDGISIYRGHCGKIAEIWTESDLAGVREQLRRE